MNGSRPRPVQFGRAVAGTSIVVTTIGVAVLAGFGRWDVIVRVFVAHHALIAVGFGAVVWIALPAQPGNRTVWVLVVVVASSALYVASQAGVAAGAGNPSLDAALELSSSELPAAASAALFFGWTAVPGLAPVFTLALLLFPDGTFATRTDRAVGWASVVCMLLAAVALAWINRPTSTLPLGAEDGFSGPGLLLGPATIGLLGAAVYAVVALIRRFRASSGEARQQYRWVLLGMAILVAGLLVSVSTGLLSHDTAGSLVELTGWSLAMAAYGIALVKYRLWNIDVIISRTLVFSVLAGFITIVYVLIVAGIGSAVSGSDLWLSVLATALVAMAFEPARTHAQRWANQLVYGERATPYEVLSEVTGTLADAEVNAGLLARMASMLRAGTGAERAWVWLQDDDGFATAASNPRSEPMVATDVSGLPGSVELIEHDGEVLGALTVETARGEGLAPAERVLMADLAGSAALFLRRLRLADELEAAARELERSRRRLVDIQDVERRRLERELHDSVEQIVAALQLALEDAARLATDEGAEEAADFVRRLADDAREATDQIRSLARGLFPPILEADGLEAAVSELAERSPLAVHVDARLWNRHPLPLEGAVYFCISEALTNASKHGRGPVSVTVSDQATELSFEVSDSGPGFDLEHAVSGAGLENMTDRLDTLGGSMSIVSTPGGSTTVAGRLPVGVPSLA